MCRAGAHGGRQAEGAGAASGEFDGGVEVYTWTKGADWDCGGVEGDVSRLGYHGDAGGAVHGHPIPALGGVEKVEAAEDGERRCYGDGEFGVWECERGGGGRGYDAAGCAEDTYDVVEGEGSCKRNVDENIEGERAESVLCWHDAEDSVD